MDLAALAVALQVNTPVLLSGKPGGGKTSAIAQLCQDVLAYHCEVVIASFRDPTEFGGLPILTADTRGVRLAAPAWVYRLIDAEVGAVIFDEINWAPGAVQAALFRVIQEGVVGDERLPPTIRRVAIMNPTDAGGGWDLQAPLANRFVHLAWHHDALAWCDGMTDGWPTPVVPRLPSTWETLIPRWTAIVTAFIRHRPLLLHHFPKDVAEQGRAWASNRSWGSLAIPLLAACEAIGAAEAIRVELLEGAVGPGAATEFLRWERDLNLPDPEQLLRHPETFVCPTRPDLVYAVLSAVASVAVSPLTLERWCAAWDIINRAADRDMTEMAALAARTLSQRQHLPPEVTTGAKLPAATAKAVLRFKPLWEAARGVAI